MPTYFLKNWKFTFLSHGIMHSLWNLCLQGNSLMTSSCSIDFKQIGHWPSSKHHNKWSCNIFQTFIKNTYLQFGLDDLLNYLRIFLKSAAAFYPGTKLKTQFDSKPQNQSRVLLNAKTDQGLGLHVKARNYVLQNNFSLCLDFICWMMN